MKVITGSARGRSLKAVEGMDVRPTTQKVKESIFSAIQFDIPGATVLDLFCGTGQLGIEALSRDAKFCVFVDSDRRSQDITKINLANTDLYKQARVVAMDYKSFLASTKDVFDIAFLDPPYNRYMISEVLPLVAEHMSNIGIIICEFDIDDTKQELLDEVGEFVLHKQYKFGRICVAKYVHRDTLIQE